MKHIKSIYTILEDYNDYNDEEDENDNYEEEDEEDDSYEDDNPTEDLPTKSYQTIAYHGTGISRSNGGYLFSYLDEDNSDWNAVWVTLEEVIADEYSSYHYDENDEDTLRIVYEINLDVDKVAEIDYATSREINNYFGYSDFRECISDLRNYNGWVVTGSIGYHQYEDIALFGRYSADIVRVKLFIDGDWTDFMSFSEANEIAEERGFIEQ